MNSMFYGCCNLNNLPSLFNWNTKNIKDEKYMFGNCFSLNEF